MRTICALIAVLGLPLATACQSERAPSTDTAQATQRAARSRTPTAILERPMALRLEGQGLLDSARVALLGEDLALTARLLQESASFLVTQAHTPPNRGTDDLLAAARGLDSLANDARRGRVIDTTSLDRLSAHANLAEAERHVALASVAWSTRSKESVSDELTMAADHIQRAAGDGRIALSPAMRRALESLYAMVRNLSAQRGLDMRDLDEPLATLHLEIQAMHSRLEQSAKVP